MWTPTPERAAQTDMARFIGLAGKKSYDELHAWSVAERGAFWNLVWEFCGVKGQKGARTLVDGDRMPGALWFPDARLNFAENLLGSRDHRDAIVFWGEDRVKRRLSHRNLYDLVSRLSQALADAGVKKGDRVAGYLPNLPEAAAAIRFEPLEFNHPLYILYSSGTTGVPKCIVHGAGGTLLQHLKEHRLHSDVKPGDRLFYFTTLGWMMWN